MGTDGKKYYITTPLYYVNSPLTVGGAYTTIVADVIARYQRGRGREVFFLTGSDEHGQKIKRAAEEKGLSPRELADQVVGTFRDLWKLLDISNDEFIRTTEPRHQAVVVEAFRRLRQSGDIYWGKYEGWYCTPCERYCVDAEAGAENRCPDCQRPLEKLSEENYFFRLSRYQGALEEHFRKHPDFVLPPFRYNEMLNRLRAGLNDVSISRSAGWGIPVPEGSAQVIWVWFDALLNYVSAPGAFFSEERFSTIWPADLQLMAKDIVWFHSLLWPALLLALGLPLPRHVFAHGWWTMGGEKISKSKGGKIFARDLVEEYGADALRYFLLREIPLGLDGDFSLSAFATRYRSDLAHDLGNLLQRTLAMVGKFRKGTIPPPGEGAGGGPMLSKAREIWARYRGMMEALQFSQVLEAVWGLVALANRYIEESKPWVLNREAGGQRRLDGVLFNLLFVLLQVSGMLAPFLPGTAVAICRQVDPRSSGPLPSSRAESGSYDIVPVGAPIGQFTPLFPLPEAKQVGNSTR